MDKLLENCNCVLVLEIAGLIILTSNQIINLLIKSLKFVEEIVADFEIEIVGLLDGYFLFCFVGVEERFEIVIHLVLHHPDLFLYFFNQLIMGCRVLQTSFVEGEFLVGLFAVFG